ncbi:MAG: LytR C-terminal domain-containing protein [Microbacteriaceae bacterium]
MANFPKDQFDTVPTDLERIGAHRAPKKKGGGWIGFAWSALATGLLVVGGLYGLSLVNDNLKFEVPGFAGGDTPVVTPSATPTPEAAPVLDPTTIDKTRKITITILNGTATPALLTAAGDTLAAQKWPVVSRSEASQNDIENTVVYYRTAADEDVARGLVIALGVGKVRESTTFLGSPITIVLGADYTPAG